MSWRPCRRREDTETGAAPAHPRGGGRDRRVAATAALLVASLLGGPPDAGGQDVRGSADLSSRVIEVRPLVRDTVPRSQVTENDQGQLVFQGHAVECLSTGVCTFLRSGEVATAVALTEDLRFTSWGFGVEGLSATVHLRGRQDLGDGFSWPRSDDPFDVIVAYGQLVREDFRLRVGRQRSLSGLGASTYDGVSFSFYPAEWITGRAYAGRSLARGLFEPRHEVLRGVEAFVEDRNAYLLGASARVIPTSGTRLTARYQREIWSNRSALLSERASLDFRSLELAPVYLQGSLDWDFAFARVGKARLSARLPLREGRVQLELGARRYVPYFELWTIWGLFNPVAYHQAEAGASWTPARGLGVRLAGGYRSYDDAGTDPLLAPTEDDAWFLSADGRYEIGDSWTLEGRYRAERGAGAFHSSGQLSARWRGVEGLTLGIHGMASQQIQEFRFGEAMVVGGGATAGVDILGDLHLNSGLAVYRQFFDNRPSGVDWSQLRAWTSLRLDLGGDPGMEGSERP